jgi:hypothetical protein
VQEEVNSGHYPALALNKAAIEALVPSIDQKKS